MTDVGARKHDCLGSAKHIVSQPWSPPTKEDHWHARAVNAHVRIGRWLSAALDDPKVCEEMKADIREWFSAGEPFEPFVDAMLAVAPPHKDPQP